MIRRLVTPLALAALVCSALPARAQDPYDIYAILPLTGGGAFLGKSEAVSLRAAEQFVNKNGGIHGRPIRVVIEDDQTNPAVSVQLANDVIAKHVPVMIGPAVNGPCSAVMPLVRAAGPVQYCLSGAIHPPAASYSFSAGVSTSDMALAGIRYFRDRGWKRIALLTSMDASGQDGEEVIKRDLALPENKDVAIVADEHFNNSDLSVTAQLERIKAAKAQAIVAWTTGSPFGTVLRSMQETGAELPVLGNAGDIINTQMAQYAAFLPKELYFAGYAFLGHEQQRSGPVRAAQDAFYSALRAQGVAPDVGYMLPWDPLLIVVDALRHLGTGASATQVRDYIEQLHGFAGINGILDFRGGNQRGLGGNATMVVRYDARTKSWIPVSKPGGVALR